MDKIAFLSRLHILQGGTGKIRAAARRVQWVPADVRHPLGAAVRVHIRDAHHAAGNQAKALVQAEFFGFVKQHLHPKADTQQQGTLGRLLLDGLDQPQLFQPLHAVLESAHAGQHQGIGCQNICRAAGHLYFCPKMGERMLHAEQVG